MRGRDAWERRAARPNSSRTEGSRCLSVLSESCSIGKKAWSLGAAVKAEHSPVHGMPPRQQRCTVYRARYPAGRPTELTTSMQPCATKRVWCLSRASAAAPRSHPTSTHLLINVFLNLCLSGGLTVFPSSSAIPGRLQQPGSHQGDGQRAQCATHQDGEHPGDLQRGGMKGWCSTDHSGSLGCWYTPAQGTCTGHGWLSAAAAAPPAAAAPQSVATQHGLSDCQRCPHQDVIAPSRVFDTLLAGGVATLVLFCQRQRGGCGPGTRQA